MERRLFSTELRITQGSNSISGTAARYDVTAKLPGFHERIAKRAFDKILRTSPDVACLVNHNSNLIIGRTASGTLQLRADDTGLHYTCDLPNTSTARDLRESIKRGDISGCSFSFALGEGDDSWSEEDDEENRGQKRVVRTIRNFSSLMDVSPVTFPAYGGTAVSVDRGNLVPAEVRSRAERISRVHAIAAKSKFRTKLFKLSDAAFSASLDKAFDRFEQGQRHKDMLDFILD